MDKLLSSAQVVYVEDDVLVLKKIGKTLGYFFHNVFATSQSMEALEYMKTHAVDILITDYVMPMMDGYELVVEAKKIKPSLVVLIMSSYTDQEKLIKCIPLGLCGYLIKPITYETLSMTLQKAISLIPTSHRILLTQDIWLDTMRKSLFIGDKEVSLTKNEYDATVFFIRNKGILVSKESLMLNVYGNMVDDNILKNLIYRLRKKVGYPIVVAHKNMGYLLE